MQIRYQQQHDLGKSGLQLYVQRRTRHSSNEQGMVRGVYQRLPDAATCHEITGRGHLDGRTHHVDPR